MKILEALEQGARITSSDGKWLVKTGQDIYSPGVFVVWKRESGQKTSRRIYVGSSLDAALSVLMEEQQ